MRLIDADALIENIRNLYCRNCDKRKGTKRGKIVFCYDIGDAPCRACNFEYAIEDLEDAPTVDAEPVRHGQWIKMSEASTWDQKRCSVCGDISCCQRSYCPNCGARMEVGDHDEADFV